MVRSPQCRCPHAQDLFILLGKKWILFIIQAVDQGASTFTEIRRDIGEANTKILTDRITELVTSRVLVKQENGDYALSKMGKDLSTKLVELSHWWGEQKQ